MVNEKMKLGVLHGAISNAGDFLICDRGKLELGGDRE